MSEENFKVMARACGILEKTFKELTQVFTEASEQAKSGCRHNAKAADKHDSRVAAAAGASGSPSKGDAKEGKKEKAKRKVVKDANGNEIKRPLSAYMLYNNHRRPTLRGEHPELSLPDLSKLIGDEWKRLSETQKSIWLEKSREQKLDYDMKSFNANKAKTGENGAAEAIQTKPAAPTEGAATMSQVAAQSAIKKNDGEDSLSPFTSDNEDAKPKATATPKPAAGATE